MTTPAKWFFTSIVAVFCLCTLAGCSTIDSFIPPRAKVDYKKGYDFRRIKKLALAPCGYSGLKTTVLSDSQEAQVNLALTGALKARGMVIVESIDDADALVDWHVVMQEQSSVRAYNADSYYQCWRCGPSISGSSVSTYTMGTFIVDIIDPELHKSVWRGIMKGRLVDLADADIQQAGIDSAAREIFGRFPPGILIDGIY